MLSFMRMPHLRPLMDHALGHREGAVADVDGKQQLALGGHGHPDPRGRPLQVFDGFGRANFAGLDRAKQGKQFIGLDLCDAHVVQDISGEGVELLCRLHQPLQHRLRIDLEHPRCAPDAHALLSMR
jgi:hypothetical protein